MKNNDKVKRWRKKNPERHKEIARSYYKRNKEMIRLKNRLYAMRKTAPGRAKLLLSQLLGESYAQIVIKAQQGKYRYTDSELKKLRTALWKNWNQ